MDLVSSSVAFQYDMSCIMGYEIRGNKEGAQNLRPFFSSFFSSFDIDLMLITRSRFKHSKIPTLITRSYVVGYFVLFCSIFFG